MNRKQKIIVSITGIVLVSLILIGLTYAYFLTKITGNINDKSISVTTANLEIKYEDNNDVITGDKIQPGVTLPSKTFTVTNNGNSTVDYSVGLVNIINTFTNTKDVVYNVTCTSYKKTGFKLNIDGTVTGTVSGTCSGKDETEFPNLNNYIVNNNIDVNIVHAYTITVTYKETGTDQSIDMNKELSAKIDIFDPKSLTIKGNVTNSRENDYVVIHSKEQESNIINGKYQFIGITPDNHTISIKNRDTTSSKDTTLNVSKGTPSVSNSKIVYSDEKNIADMDINVSSNTITLDITKISEPPQTLKDTILASAKKGGENRTILGSTVTEFTSISGENERVLNNAPDDYGTSYYFRGNVLDNYVSFADRLWRIVRINGDGSIRIIMDNDSYVDEKAFFQQTGSGDNSRIGYMYGMSNQDATNINQCVVVDIDNNTEAIDDKINNSEEKCLSVGGKWDKTPYDATHVNVADSSMKTALDTWYKANILNTNNNDYIADTLFCNDKTLASDGIGGVTTQLGYGKNETYYASTERLLYSTEKTSLTIAKPTFKCAESATNDYSRFTVNVGTLPNGNKTNGDLRYSIGIISIDELIYSGYFMNVATNNSFINLTEDSVGFTLTPFSYKAYSNSIVWGFDCNYISELSTSFVMHFFPVLNLKAETLKSAGDGTKENPYIVKLNENIE